MKQYSVNLDVTILGPNGQLIDARSQFPKYQHGYQPSTLQVDGHGRTFGQAAAAFVQNVDQLLGSAQAAENIPVLMGTYLQGERPAITHPVHDLLAAVRPDMGMYRSLLLNARFSFPLYQGPARTKEEQRATDAVRVSQLRAAISLVPLYTAFLGSSPMDDKRDQRAEYVTQAGIGDTLTRYQLVPSLRPQTSALKYEMQKFSAAAKVYIKELKRIDRARAARLVTALHAFDVTKLVMSPWTVTTGGGKASIQLQADSCPDLESVVGMMALTHGALEAAAKLPGDRLLIPKESKLKTMEIYARFFGLEDRSENRNLREHAAWMLDFAEAGLSGYECALLTPLRERFATQQNPADDMRAALSSGGYQAIHDKILVPSAQRALAQAETVAAMTPEPVVVLPQRRSHLVPASVAQVAASLASMVFLR